MAFARTAIWLIAVFVTVGCLMPGGVAQAGKASAAAAQASSANQARPDQVREIQRLLRKLKRLSGSADGIAGPRTDRALKAFQTDLGLPQTGLPTDGLALDELIGRLRAAVAPDAGHRSPAPAATAAYLTHQSVAADGHHGHDGHGGHQDAHGGHGGHGGDHLVSHTDVSAAVTLTAAIAHHIGESLEFFEMAEKLNGVFQPLVKGDTTSAVSHGAGVATEYSIAAHLVASLEIAALVGSGLLADTIAGIAGVVAITRIAGFFGDQVQQFAHDTLTPPPPPPAPVRRKVARK